MQGDDHPYQTTVYGRRGGKATAQRAAVQGERHHAVIVDEQAQAMAAANGVSVVTARRALQAALDLQASEGTPNGPMAPREQLRFDAVTERRRKADARRAGARAARKRAKAGRRANRR